LIRRATSLGSRIASNLAQFSYTLYVIHYPLLLLSFSLLHPSLHNHGWVTSLIAGLAALVPIIYISSRLALIVENRKLLKRAVFRVRRLQNASQT
jgi:peptidoglycan/LPS O-acetylase OafA/YrhL